nr:MAG TPA: hypothetical protein [Caudoviricetes sp.]
MLKEKCELAYSRGQFHGYMFALSRKKDRHIRTREKSLVLRYKTV